jgi:hypothetical protein
MRRLLLLLVPLLLLMAACGGGTAAPTAPAVAPSIEADVSVPTQSADTAEPTASQEQEENTEASTSIAADKSSVVTSSDPLVAGVARPEDYTKGATDPIVTIVEYGDFQ